MLCLIIYLSPLVFCLSLCALLAERGIRANFYKCSSYHGSSFLVAQSHAVQLHVWIVQPHEWRWLNGLFPDKYPFVRLLIGWESSAWLDLPMWAYCSHIDPCTMAFMLAIQLLLAVSPFINNILHNLLNCLWTTRFRFVFLHWGTDFNTCWWAVFTYSWESNELEGLSVQLLHCMKPEMWCWPIFRNWCPVNPAFFSYCMGFWASVISWWFPCISIYRRRRWCPATFLEDYGKLILSYYIESNHWFIWAGYLQDVQQRPFPSLLPDYFNWRWQGLNQGPSIPPLKLCLFPNSQRRGQKATNVIRLISFWIIPSNSRF